MFKFITSRITKHNINKMQIEYAEHFEKYRNVTPEIVVDKFKISKELFLPNKKLFFDAAVKQKIDKERLKKVAGLEKDPLLDEAKRLAKYYGEENQEKLIFDFHKAIKFGIEYRKNLEKGNK